MFILTLGLVVAACSAAPSEQAGSGVADAFVGAEAPEEAVTSVLSALQAGDYARAAEQSTTEQLPVVAMAEGADVAQIEGLITSGDTAVGVNFWRSFAEGLGTFVGVTPDQIRIADVQPFEVSGRRFARVAVEFPNDPNVRSFVAQDSNGWKVDLLASFAPGLAGRIETAANAFHSNNDAAEILEYVATQRPSLEAALQDPEITPDIDQDVRAALVAIGP